MDKKYYIYLLISIGIFFLGVIASLYIFLFIQGKDSQLSQFSSQRESGYEYISPLLDCEYISPVSENRSKRIKNSVNQEVATLIQTNKADRISVYFRDLANGPWFGIDEDATFSPASLLKVPVMLAIYKEAEITPELLNMSIPFDPSRLVPRQSGNQFLPDEYRPKEKLEVDVEYSVEELMNRMISYSDNDAFDTLMYVIPVDAIQKVHTDLGLIFPDNNTPEDYVTVKSYASLFRVLYNSSYLTRDYSSEALSFMADTTFDLGISGGVPKDVKVANKFGVRYINNGQESFQLHDCGIIYYSDNPYLLCVMTQGKEIEGLGESISTISKVVYEGISSK
jgi:beta-lactamase class A